MIAEIIGLDDLGRALLIAQKTDEREPELRQIAGEITARGPAAERPRPPKKR